MQARACTLRHGFFKSVAAASSGPFNFAIFIVSPNAKLTTRADETKSERRGNRVETMKHYGTFPKEEA
jgi:hypothetical protein